MSLKSAPVPGARPGGSRRAAALVAAVAAGGLLAAALTGCSPTTNYVGSAEQGLYFEVPNTWSTFTGTTLTRLQLVNRQEISTAASEEETYPVYVSLSSAVTSNHFQNGLSGAYPWALATVQSLGVSDQQTISLQALENQIWPVSEEVGSETQLFPTKVISQGALRGTIIGYQINTPTGDLAFEQAAVINSATTKVWILSVGCAPACFQAHKAIFQHIISTFTVTGHKG